VNVGSVASVEDSVFHNNSGLVVGGGNGLAALVAAGIFSKSLHVFFQSSHLTISRLDTNVSWMTAHLYDCTACGDFLPACSVFGDVFVLSLTSRRHE
jgi:hypothetical protein